MATRRDVLKGSLAAAGLAAFGIPDWAVPALAAGETVVPFTDIPANFATNPSDVVRVLDIRNIENGPTPKDQFFTTQHYGHPTIDPAAFRLKLTGLIDHPRSLSLDEAGDLQTKGGRVDDGMTVVLRREELIFWRRSVLDVTNIEDADDVARVRSEVLRDVRERDYGLARGERGHGPLGDA